MCDGALNDNSQSCSYAHLLKLLVNLLNELMYFALLFSQSIERIARRWISAFLKIAYIPNLLPIAQNCQFTSADNMSQLLFFPQVNIDLCLADALSSFLLCERTSNQCLQICSEALWGSSRSFQGICRVLPFATACFCEARFQSGISTKTIYYNKWNVEADIKSVSFLLSYIPFQNF